MANKQISMKRYVRNRIFRHKHCCEWREQQAVYYLKLGGIVQSVQRLARTRRFGVRSPVEGNFSVLFTCPDRSGGTPSPLFNLCWKFFLRLKRPRLDIELPHHLEPRVSIGRTIPLLSSLRLVCLYTWGAQVFQIHRRHLKIPEARYLSRSKVHTEDPQTL